MVNGEWDELFLKWKKKHSSLHQLFNAYYAYSRLVKIQVQAQNRSMLFNLRPKCSVPISMLFFVCFFVYGIEYRDTKWRRFEELKYEQSRPAYLHFKNQMKMMQVQNLPKFCLFSSKNCLMFVIQCSIFPVHCARFIIRNHKGCQSFHFTLVRRVLNLCDAKANIKKGANLCKWKDGILLLMFRFVSSRSVHLEGEESKLL